MIFAILLVLKEETVDIFSHMYYIIIKGELHAVKPIAHNILYKGMNCGKWNIRDRRFVSTR